MPSRSRSRPRSMSSRSQPRNTDPRFSELGLKRGATFASATSRRFACAQPVAHRPEFLWPNSLSSTRLAERGCCRTLDHHVPGGTVPVVIQDRRCLCPKLQSWPCLAPRSFWALARSTIPHPSRFRRLSWSNPFRPSNSVRLVTPAPAQSAPVAVLSSATFKGAAC